MSKVKSGQLDAYVSITTHDEIGELSGQFNSMLSEINTLMERIITEQEAKRSADILALQTQMNPHFLFNTLATIRSLVCANAFDKADTVLISLSMLLKDLLSSNEPFSTLNKEIQNLQEYINIQKLTFEPPLNVHIQIPPEMHNIKIMKMLLQPLVENALLHGLKPKRDNCRLNIEGYLEKEMAVISIADNGVGFNPDILEHYSHDLSADKRSIGIKNVVDRIKLHYGAQCSIIINSEINVGTTVIVRFPQSYTREDFKL